MSSACFEPEGLSSGRRLYMQVWNCVFYKLKLFIRYLSMKYLDFLNISIWA